MEENQLSTGSTRRAIPQYRVGTWLKTQEGIEGRVWWQRGEMILLAVEGEKGYYPTLASEVKR